MEYLLLISIGIVMGLFGGLLGIGGSVIMIPALVLFFGLGSGENQHLYQASAMICNFFVAAAATFAHQKARTLVPDTLKTLIPGAVLGVIAGVLLSNTHFFAGRNGWILTRIFGAFLIYVTAFNILRLIRPPVRSQPEDRDFRQSTPLSLLNGLLTGIAAGLLGIGGGTLLIPLQQITLKMPLKRAISNSAATIILIALIGAILKNLTLGEHGIAIRESLRIAALVAPTGLIGGFIGARLLHLLPKNIVRIALIGLLAVAAYKLLTAAPAG
jgi:uncharacterized membrane protein YfcA